MKNQMEIEEIRERVVDIRFDIIEFKKTLSKVLKERVKLNSIENIAEDIEIAIALYYKGENHQSAEKSPCNIMLSTGFSNIVNIITYESYEKQNVIEQIKVIMQENLSGVNDTVDNEIGYKGKPEVNQNVLIVFGVYIPADQDIDIKCRILKKIILDFLKEKIDNMVVFSQLSTEGDVFWEDIACNFIEKYKEKVFSELNLPLIEKVELVSEAYYEKRECHGGIIFTSSENTDKNIIELDKSDKWLFENTSFVRKMLEIATEECYMLVQEQEKQYQIRGFYPKITQEDLKKQMVYIWFSGNYSYAVFSQGEEILRCEKGNYCLPKKDIEMDIEEICREHKNLPGLKIILESWDKIEHGAIFIFAEDAREICENLCKKYKRGTIVDPFNIEEKKDFFLRLSAVDGAVLADKKGKCYAYGMILDGAAVVEADLTRGSRFNSAKNYVHNNKGRLAVVISEDKDKKPDILSE